MKPIHVLLGAFALAGGAHAASNDIPDPLAHWTWRNPLPIGNELRSVAYGSGTHVVVGAVGTILTSPDGAGWSRRSAGTSEYLNAVVFGEGQFVAVGAVGTAPAAILTSPDGSTWTSRPSEVTNGLYGVGFGNGRYVAVGWKAIVGTSTNGIHWRVGNAALGANVVRLDSIAYGAGLFVAVGTRGVIRTSADGETWTARTSGTSANLSSVSFGRGSFVVTGNGGVILTSPDGIDWTPSNSGTGVQLYASAHRDRGFVVTGDGIILTSSDGTAWMPNANPPSYANRLGRLGFGGGLFVAVGTGVIATSPEGSTWTTRSSGSIDASLSDLAYGNAHFVAVGQGGTLISSDGYRWTRGASGGPVDIVRGVCFGQSQFVAVGPAGGVFTSPDGINWRSRISGTTLDLDRVGFGNGQFVALGADLDSLTRTVIASADGSNWSTRILESIPNMSGAFTGIAYGNGVFVVTTIDGVMRTSTDAVNWTAQAAGTVTLTGVTFGDGQFVAVGDAGVITSTNGATWVQRTIPTLVPSIYLQGVTFGGGVFVARGSGGIGLGSSIEHFLTSTDGANWTLHSAEVDSSSVNGLGYGDGQFFVVGDSAAILGCDFRPRLGTPSLLPSVGVQIPFAAVSGLSYSLETSTNLIHWFDSTNAVATNGGGAFTDSSATNSMQRFYRARSRQD